MTVWPTTGSTGWDGPVKDYIDAIAPDGGVRAVGKAEIRVLDADYSTLEAAFNATPVGGTLEIRKQWLRGSAGFTVDKAVTVEYAQTGRIITGAATAGLTVAASGVTLRYPTGTGPGYTTAGTSVGISVVGTVAAPITGLVIKQPTLDSYDKYGIYLENVTGFVISKPNITNIAYAGILGLSCSRGSVLGGVVSNVTQPSGFANSYGIAWSRDSTKSLTDGPRSRDILVEGVVVDGVASWEGLDTHAGVNITFRDCDVFNCRTGIAVVGGKGSDGAGGSTAGVVYAPQQCKVIGCTIDGVVTDGTRGVGVVLAGAADTLGSPTELAVGCKIVDNTVINMGTENTSTGSSIQVYGTSGARISGNHVINSGFSGVDIYHDNYGATVQGNTVIDAWSNSSTVAYCFQIRSDYNTVTLSGNQIVRATKTATHVNDRGLNVAGSLTNTAIVDAGGNNWDAASALPTSGIALLSSFRSFATKTGFNGVAPVGKAANPGTATGTDAAVINAVVTAGRNLGWWS